MKNRSLLVIALAAFLATALVSFADPDSWEFRLRATYLSMDNKSDAFSALGLNFPANAVSINSKFIPEFDASYRFTANFSAELVLTVPQTQEVTLAGVGQLGTFKHLPPVLSAQYHFLPGQLVDPYIGVGVNYTLIFDSNLKVANVPLFLDNHSVGLAGQAGADVDLGHGLFLNVDAKKVGLTSGVYVPGGAQLTTATLDPWLLSAGIGWRF